MKYLPIFLLGLALSSTDAQLKPRSFEAWDIFLYQPDNVLQERLSGSVKGLADYTKRLMSTCEASFASPPMPETLNIIVAVRPGKALSRLVCFLSAYQHTAAAGTSEKA